MPRPACLAKAIAFATAQRITLSRPGPQGPASARPSAGAGLSGFGAANVSDLCVAPVRAGRGPDAAPAGVKFDQIP